MSEKTRTKSFERPDQFIETHTKRRLLKVVQYSVLIGLLIYIAFPVLWMMLSAFKTPSQIFGTPHLIPSNPTLENFSVLLTETVFPTYLGNSIIVAIGATLLTTTLATLGGYGLTRSEFRSKKTLARTVLLTYMFPPILLGIPLYIIFYNLGLLNTPLVLMVAHTAIALPFCLWLMWQYFQTVPIAYEESAWIYGATRFQTFRKIVLPMALPGIIAIAIFAFAVSWNDFTMAVVLMTETSAKTFPVGIKDFLASQQVNWGIVNAAGFMIIVPPLLLVFFLQKYIMVGFQIGR
ncbi:carbohydrate ABC transporter permease [Natrinema sp. 74]|uniref:carbohydrate ABC transporter permease n=1 Tax=Natrinema sp. 74 TaxID=3384159 RepID=UPI0038D40464